MAGITTRNLDDNVKTRLRVRAANNGRSMEEEARLGSGSVWNSVRCPAQAAVRVSRGEGFVGRCLDPTRWCCDRSPMLPPTPKPRCPRDGNQLAVQVVQESVAEAKPSAARLSR